MCTAGLGLTIPAAQAQAQAQAQGAAATAVAMALPAGVRRVTAVEGIEEYRLANGLQVLLVPDDSKPSTTVNLTFRVGSRHENYGETGMAHLLEHLMFKGSPKHPKVWAEFTRRGLNANGSTWLDRTNYTATFAASEDNLRWYLGWQADAMVNSFIARKDLDSEMTVVRNEMEMGENDPGSILFERTVAAMYQWHNYGHSTIGARADVENVDIPRLQAFYRTYYQPDNATLIVSGRFEPAKVLGWIARAYAGVPRPTRVLPRLYTLDPVQDGEREVTLRRVGGVPLLYAGYHVPPGAHPDHAAVEVLALLMGDAPAGRLHRALTERRLAAATFAFAPGLADPGFALFGAQLAPGQDPAEARAAMLRTLESVASEPVTAEELQRARDKWLNDWERAFSDPEVVGISLSETVAQGDWRLFFLARDRVRALTLDTLQRVAVQVLLPANRTLGSYVPTERPQRAPQPQRVDLAQAMAGFVPQAAADRVPPFDASPANIDRRTERFSEAGIAAAVLAKPTRGGAVQAVLTLRFGDEKSLAGQGQVPSMLAELLDKGSARLSRQQVQDRLSALKTELAFSAGAGRLTVSLQSRREHVADALALVAELLRTPALPADALEEVRRQTLAAIEQQRKEPEAVLANALARHGNPYPPGDVRYARSFDEIVRDVEAVRLEQLRAFHQRFYGTGQAQFAAVGDLDVPALRRALREGFAGWQAGEPFARIPQPRIEVAPARLVFQTPDKQNATMSVQLALPLADTDPDYPALMMANHLLGGGGNSRLWKRIREQDGLSYNVYSGVAWNPFEPNSGWSAGAIFAPQNQAKVEAAFREELARALKDGFSAAELAEGQRGLLAFRQLGRAQDAGLAAALSSNLYLGRDFARAAEVDRALAALTPAQVLEALRKYVLPERLVSGFAGDFKP
ncbi:zinc protease [Piscinibacter sakaiensis]|uniref:Zinc protease n=1 Tax=Piscinibacter sakaiensis TaxID=1547922 RepID=A0A0K8P752_PISS1|nr:zinc protease [Piscinibacter sakaiensis]